MKSRSSSGKRDGILIIGKGAGNLNDRKSYKLLFISACSTSVIGFEFWTSVCRIRLTIFDSEVLPDNRKIRRDSDVDRCSPSLGGDHSTRLRQSFSSYFGVLI